MHANLHHHRPQHNVCWRSRSSNHRRLLNCVQMLYGMRARVGTVRVHPWKVTVITTPWCMRVALTAWNVAASLMLPRVPHALGLSVGLFALRTSKTIFRQPELHDCQPRSMAAVRARALQHASIASRSSAWWRLYVPLHGRAWLMTAPVSFDVIHRRSHTGRVQHIPTNCPSWAGFWTAVAVSPRHAEFRHWV